MAKKPFRFKASFCLQNRCELAGQHFPSEIPCSSAEYLADLESISKALRPAVAISWEYAKIEIVPPFTQAFFKGPGGRALEASCGGAADSVIGILQNTVKGIDDAEASRIAQKAAQEKAKLEKVKAEAEAKRKQTEQAAKTKAAKEAKEAAAKAPEPKKAEAKKPEPKKAKAEKPAPKKPEPKKK